MMRKIMETDLAKLFFSERGLRKLLRGRQYYPVINQCDDEEKLMQAGKIAKQLKYYSVNGCQMFLGSTGRENSSSDWKLFLEK